MVRGAGGISPGIREVSVYYRSRLVPLILKLLKRKRGLGDCPQGFDFVFELKQKGFHAPLLTVFLNLNKNTSSFRLSIESQILRSKVKIEDFYLKSKP
ncbi:MAG: hypothetical protein HQL75_01245 [Magnetococcales bacterium]|nr:hypothetical protein [Magnetococcales bacterium]